MTAEDYYVSAFNEMSDMLAGRDSLSIKRAVFLAEWAYYEGNLDYKTDFCDEIDRIKKFILSFYAVNKLHTYKTGMQMAISSYIVSPYSGNNYTPYTYDFETFSMDKEPWERQFVSRTLKTHKGQCRSLPWMYKILASELNAEASLAHAPRHCYIMYKDEDKITPEEWINLELTTNQMNPSWWIKQDFEICDSAVQVGTYMPPLTDPETVACQMAELAFGYHEKFNRYDEFTYYCASRSLEFYPMNPNAWIIRGKSLERIIQDYLARTGNIVDDYAAYLIQLMDETKHSFDINGGVPVAFINNRGGGGLTTPINNGTYSLIFKNSSFHPNGRAVTTGHEIIGHGRSLALGRGDLNQHVDAIQTENLILRVMGIPFINTGANHVPNGAFPGCSLLPSFR